MEEQEYVFKKVKLMRSVHLLVEQQFEDWMLAALQLLFINSILSSVLQLSNKSGRFWKGKRERS